MIDVLVGNEVTEECQRKWYGMSLLTVLVDAAVCKTCRERFLLVALTLSVMAVYLYFFLSVREIQQCNHV